MGIDFPVPTAVDEVFSDPTTGKSWKWDSVAWKIDASGGATASEFVLKAGDTMGGALHLPTAQPVATTESTHKQYVDTAIAAKSLYQGVWQVAANSPDITPSAAILHSYSWIANTVDANLPETAPAALPGIGGVLITAGDTVIWNANTSLYELVRSPASVSGDFVEVTGDQMTGPLEVQSAPANGKMSLVPGDATNNGRLEWHNPDGTRKAYIGYQGTTSLQINLDGASALNINGGVLNVDNNIVLFGANIGVTFPGGSRIYDHTDKALRICGRSNIQPQIANADGSGGRDVIDTTNGDARYLRSAAGTTTAAVFTSGWIGTMDFRVSQMAVTMRMVLDTQAAGAGISFKLAAYPSGVPAPYAQLEVTCMTHWTTGNWSPHNWVRIQARTDGIWVQICNAAISVGHKVATTITWAR